MNNQSVSISDGVIQMSDGGYFHFTDPARTPFDVEVIAHALSNICRFGGHCREFYSVAQHSVLVSHHVPYEYALEALFHDAAEAFVGDVCSPLKRKLYPLFHEIESGVEKDIRNRFQIQDPDGMVKDADLRALSTEKRDLMPPNSPWSVEVTHPAFDEPILPLLPAEAKRQFIQRYRMLTR